MDLASQYSMHKISPSVVAIAHHCPVCSMFDLDFGDDYEKNARKTSLELAREILRDVSGRKLKKNLKNFIIFPLKVADLAGWALSGCSFCEFLHEKMGHPSMLSKRDGKKYIAAELKHDDNHIYFGPLESTQDAQNGRSPRINFKLAIEQTFLFRPVVSSKSRLSKHIAHRPVNCDPSSEATLQLTIKWLSKCVSEHAECNSQVGLFMPRRLIRLKQINGDVQINLIEGSAYPPEPYAALSYCWGGPQRITTTKSTISQHMKRIDGEQLPKTLKDAVRVTLALGITLLWIDALCIIQDDLYHKPIEIAQMPRVYGGARVTIVASRSHSAENGFLHVRQLSDYESDGQTFRVKFRAPDGTKGAVNLLPLHPLVEEDDDAEDEPLDHRSWAFQERLLSPRIVEFGSWRTQYICKHGLRERKLPSDGWSSHIVWSDHRRDLPEGFKQWTRYVETYTSRDLTFSIDRPLAISGVAEMFASKSSGTYIAGLWTSNMPQALLWTVSGPPKAPPAMYQGPSWSWIGVNGPINPSTFTGDLQPVPKLQVLSYRTTLSECKAPFGAVTSASLTIKATIVPVKYICDPRPSSRRVYFFVRMSEHPNGDISPIPELPLAVSCIEDTIDRSWFPTFSYSTVLYLLFVGEDRDGLKGLVLRAVDETKNVYARVASFYTYRLIRKLDSYRKRDFDTGDSVEAQAEKQRAWVLAQGSRALTLV